MLFDFISGKKNYHIYIYVLQIVCVNSKIKSK